MGNTGRNQKKKGPKGNGKGNGRSHGGAYNRSAPWTPFVKLPLIDDMVAQGIAAAFENSHYRVFIKEGESKSFLDEEGKPMIVHMMLVHKGGQEISWSMIQRIKNELVSEFSDCLEMFPSEARRMNVKQRHIWCFPPGYTFPIGLIPRDPHIDQAMKDVQKIIDETMFFVVRVDDKTYEVYANEVEVRAKYPDNMPEAKPLPLSHVPTGKSTTFTDGAKVLFEDAQKRINTIMMALQPANAPAPDADKNEPSLEPEVAPDPTDAPKLAVVPDAPTSPDDAEAEAAAAEDLRKMREGMVKKDGTDEGKDGDGGASAPN